MNRLLLAAPFCFLAAASGAAAGPVLQFTIDAPTELRTTAVDAFTFSVKNVGNATVDGTDLRFSLGSLQVASIPSWCQQVQESPNGSLPAVQLVKCALSRVSVNATKSVTILLRAPASQANLQLTAYARGTTGGSFASNSWLLRARHSFTPNLVLPADLTGHACYGTVPVDFDWCPPGSHIPGGLRLLPGNVVDGMPPGSSWTRPTPDRLTITLVDGTFLSTWTLRAIDAKCFRGPATNNGPYSYGAVEMCLP